MNSSAHIGIDDVKGTCGGESVVCALDDSGSPVHDVCAPADKLNVPTAGNAF